MTTPTEDIWPGVTDLKDYKPTFPTWSENRLKVSVKNMNTEAVDLLQVIKYNFSIFFFFNCLAILLLYKYFFVLENVNLRSK